MEIKDVQNPNSSGGQENSKPVAASRLQPLKAANPPSKPKSEAVNVEVNSSVTQAVNSEVRGRANQVLNVINVASEAANEIDKLVKGIEGIVGQAEQIVSADQGGSARRVPVLENEAKQLVDAIRQQAGAEAPNGVRPLAGDKIRLELEEKLGKTLEVLLPEAARSGLGLGEVRLSTKDAIINTRASVEEAKARVQSLRDAIGDTFKEVQNIVASLEVAFQNSEAARASIRDVDEAVKVVSETTSLINKNPQVAIDAAGVSPSSLQLLKL